MWNIFQAFWRERSPSLISIYALGILFTLHAVLPVYINSTYLAGIFGERLVGLLYAIGYGLAIPSLFLMPKALTKFGVRNVSMALIGIELAALVSLAVSSVPAIILFSFSAHVVTIVLVFFNIDIFLESASKDSETGSIRGTYLTFNNIGWLVAPSLAGLLLHETEFANVYAAAALFLMGALFALTKFPNQKKAHQKGVFQSSIARLFENKDLFYITIVNFFLQLFFAVMVIYTPLYLHEHIGFTLREIGFMFTIALSAYVLVEIPLGRIADAIYGEQEILQLGFILLAATAGLLSFITSGSFVVWAILLFLTRLGAAMVEVMSETYFFKKTSSDDTDLLAFYRSMPSLSYVLAPIGAAAFMLYLDLQYLFVGVATLMLIALYFSTRITDTK